MYEYFDLKELLKKVSETRFFINPINNHNIEHIKISNTFGLYIIDNEYSFIYSNNKNISLYLCDHTVIKDKGTLNFIKVLITKYEHDRLLKITEVIKRESEI